MYEKLRPIMKTAGVQIEPKAFYWAVNSAYHEAESHLYDEAHTDMYAWGQQLWSFLSHYINHSSKSVNILDIGCGTGLVGSFLNEHCSDHVESLTQLDPNDGMLAKAQQRSQEWSFPSIARKGEVFSLDGNEQFDIVIASSVLHHVVETHEFLSKVQDLMRINGFFITTQDPVFEYYRDSIFASRKRELLAAQGFSSKSSAFRRYLGSLKRRVFNAPQEHPLAAAVNRTLLKDGIVRRPLAIEVIWSITDFHVPEQPGGIGSGFSQTALASNLSKLTLCEWRTYQFYGASYSSLSSEFQNSEIDLWNSKDTHGQLFCSVWQKGPTSWVKFNVSSTASNQTGWTNAILASKMLRYVYLHI